MLSDHVITFLSFFSLIAPVECTVQCRLEMASVDILALFLTLGEIIQAFTIKIPFVRLRKFPSLPKGFHALPTQLRKEGAAGYSPLAIPTEGC